MYGYKSGPTPSRIWRFLLQHFRLIFCAISALGTVQKIEQAYITSDFVFPIATVDKYEVGDLSGKYGTIGAKDTLSLVRKDYNLPLFGGNSIMFRSMVIHYNNGSRWVCSNINPKNAEFLFKVQAKFNGPEFDGNLVVVSLLKKFC